MRFRLSTPGLAMLLLAGCSSGPAATSPTASPTVEPTAATPPAEGTPFHLNTPGPTVPEGHWRWAGSVIDQDSKPLPGACLPIGPGGRRFNSIRTDDQGKWVIDFPQVNVEYDFHFVKDGYQTVDQSIQTTGPGDFQVRMIPTK